MATTPYQLRSVGDNSSRNLVINGNFDFWQRGITISNTVNTTKYLADRWNIQLAGTTTGTNSQSADVPTIAQSGYQSRYSNLFTNGSAVTSFGASDYAQMAYRMEGQDYQNIHGKRWRLQFWVKASVAGPYCVGIQSGNNPLRGYIATYTTYTINSANTWEKKTLDIAAETTNTGYLFDNSIGLFLQWQLASGGSNTTSSTLNQWSTTNTFVANTQTNLVGTAGATFQLAQVMIIPGTFDSGAVTNFQRAGRTIGDELRMCQRYYEKSYDVNTTPGTVTANNGLVRVYTPAAWPTLNNMFHVSYSVPKRSATNTWTPYTNAGVINRIRDATGGADIVADNVNAGETGTQIRQSSGGTIAAGSVIEYFWTVEAEL